MATNPAPDSLYLQATESLKRSIADLCSASDGVSESDKQKLETFKSEDRISLQQLRLVHSLLKLKNAADGTLSTLLKGSKVLGAKKKPEPVNPELETRRQYLRNRQEQREYNAMVADIAPNMEPKETFSSYKEQLNVGINMIVSMAVMYIVCYFAASGIFREESQKMVCGLAGIVIIILVETALHVVREYEAENYRQPKAMTSTFGLNAIGINAGRNK